MRTDESNEAGRSMARRGAGLAAAVLAALLAASCGGGSDDTPYAAEIRRTPLGVPFIQADNWQGLGYGVGYAQAQDMLCTLADAFLTYRGERSRWLGGDADAVYDSTINSPRNLDSDFFHRHVMPADKVAAMAAAQSDQIRQLVDGYVTGYNRYVREVKAGSGGQHACGSEPWVAAIDANDLWRRLYHAMLAGGYSNFVAEIANAAPPAPGAGPSSAAQAPRMRTLALNLGGEDGVGSNMIGFGAQGTADGQSMLFGNPHWYWRGADRFYQAQLSIPGQLRAAGALWPGIPMVLIGYNENIAWSHTVSTARRFGFFELTLAAGDPTSYMLDGAAVAMQPHAIEVQSLQGDGSVATVSRTLYGTQYGPVVDLGGPLGWSDTTAIAIRDINADNFRAFRSWLGWGQAKSLEDFMAVQREFSAVPWVNTVAVGRGDRRAWYGDIGTMPNVTPEQAADCATPLGQAVAGALPSGVPFLDGSRAACQWRDDADSKQPGAMGTSRMPSLLREDYVANMNDSHWLANPAQPLTGFPSLVGPEGSVPQSFRTRLGHLIAQGRIAGTDGAGPAGATVDTVKSVVLNSRVYTAELFKDEALAMVCTTPPANADVGTACDVLAAWNNAGNADARGAHVWDEFWSRAARLGASALYAVPFDPADPVNTPRGLKPTAAAGLATAFQQAVAYVKSTPYALDAQRSEYLFATRAGEHVGLYGGCGGPGYFTIACSDHALGDGGYTMDFDPNGNSYMQIVRFTDGGGVEAHTFLTHGQPEDTASPVAAAYTRAYAQKAWVRQPFTDAEIAASAGVQTQRISE